MTYKTSDVARIIGVHPNTVRFYEAMSLISPAERAPNGYRIYTPLHIDQFKLARSAFAVEILHHGLRDMAVALIKTAASGDYDLALFQAEAYLESLQAEVKGAQDAIFITHELLAHNPLANESQQRKRHEAAALLGITIDTLRNWELNGLLQVKRRQNGYRVYDGADINRLKIIRTLRHAGYSLSAILRLLNSLDENPGADIQNTLDTPNDEDDIILACDRYITSLHRAVGDAQDMIGALYRMKDTYGQ